MPRSKQKVVYCKTCVKRLPKGYKGWTCLACLVVRHRLHPDWSRELQDTSPERVALVEGHAERIAREEKRRSHAISDPGQMLPL